MSLATRAAFALTILVSVSAADPTPRIEFSLVQTEAGAVKVEARLRNTSVSRIFFTEQSVDWDYQIEVIGPDERPLDLTDWGKCVLPHPREIFRNILRELEPGEDNEVESVELNRLFKLDRIGLHRIVVSRRIWSKTPARAQIVSSEPAFFDMTSPRPDTSPKANPKTCR